MLVKTITYTDYNGNTRTEDFYFNYSRAETMRLQMSTREGLDKFLRRIVDEQDTPTMFKWLEEFVIKSYGKKSEDGKRFVKTPEIANEFAESEAYSELLMEFINGGDEAIAKFINAVVPKPADGPQDHKQAEVSAKAEVVDMPISTQA